MTKDKNDSKKPELDNKNPPISRSIDLSQKTISSIIGEVVWLISQDSYQKSRSIHSLEYDVLPSIVRRSFKIFYEDNHSTTSQNDKYSTYARPVGFVAWMYLTDDLKNEIQDDPTRLTRLDPSDWGSGAVPIIILTVAPFGGASAMVAEVSKLLHSDQPIQS